MPLPMMRKSARRYTPLLLLLSYHRHPMEEPVPPAPDAIRLDVLAEAHRYAIEIAPALSTRLPSLLEASKVPIPRLLQNPDGIRMLDANRLLVTENPGALNVIDVRSGRITQVGTFDQPTSVVRSGGYLWVAEGQVLRLQQGQPPNLPFKIQRAPVPITDL